MSAVLARKHAIQTGRRARFIATIAAIAVVIIHMVEWHHRWTVQTSERLWWIIKRCSFCLIQIGIESFVVFQLPNSLSKLTPSGLFVQQTLKTNKLSIATDAFSILGIGCIIGKISASFDFRRLFSFKNLIRVKLIWIMCTKSSIHTCATVTVSVGFLKRRIPYVWSEWGLAENHFTSFLSNQQSQRPVAESKAPCMRTWNKPQESFKLWELVSCWNRNTNFQSLNEIWDYDTAKTSKKNVVDFF